MTKVPNLTTKICLLLAFTLVKLQNKSMSNRPGKNFNEFYKLRQTNGREDRQPITETESNLNNLNSLFSATTDNSQASTRMGIRPDKNLLVGKNIADKFLETSNLNFIARLKKNTEVYSRIMRSLDYVDTKSILVDSDLFPNTDSQKIILPLFAPAIKAETPPKQNIPIEKNEIPGNPYMKIYQNNQVGVDPLFTFQFYNNNFTIDENFINNKPFVNLKFDLSGPPKYFNIKSNTKFTFIDSLKSFKTKAITVTPVQGCILPIVMLVNSDPDFAIDPSFTPSSMTFQGAAVGVNLSDPKEFPIMLSNTQYKLFPTNRRLTNDKSFLSHPVNYSMPYNPELFTQTVFFPDEIVGKILEKVQLQIYCPWFVNLTTDSDSDNFNSVIISNQAEYSLKYFFYNDTNTNISDHIVTSPYSITFIIVNPIDLPRNISVSSQPVQFICNQQEGVANLPLVSVGRARSTRTSFNETINAGWSLWCYFIVYNTTGFGNTTLNVNITGGFDPVSSDTKTKIAIGLSIGGFAFVAIFIALIVLFFQHKRKQEEFRRDPMENTNIIADKTNDYVHITEFAMDTMNLKTRIKPTLHLPIGSYTETTDPNYYETDIEHARQVIMSTGVTDHYNTSVKKTSEFSLPKNKKENLSISSSNQST